MSVIQEALPGTGNPGVRNGYCWSVNLERRELEYSLKRDAPHLAGTEIFFISKNAMYALQTRDPKSILFEEEELLAFLVKSCELSRPDKK
jgi:hypothetical protein